MRRQDVTVFAFSSQRGRPAPRSLPPGVGPSCQTSHSSTFFHPPHPSSLPKEEGEEKCPPPVPHARRPTPAPFAPFHPSPRPSPKGRGRNARRPLVMPILTVMLVLTVIPTASTVIPAAPHCHSRSFKRESSILSFPARGGCGPRPSPSPLATDHYPLVRQQRQINVHADAGENRAARGAVE